MGSHSEPDIRLTPTKRRINKPDHECVRCSYQAPANKPERMDRHEKDCYFNWYYKFPCRNKQFGCKYEGNVDERRVHRFECIYRLKPCDACHMKIRVIYHDSHLKSECPMRCVECKACDGKMLAKDLTTHMPECKMNITKTCEYCLKGVQLNEIDYHFVICCRNAMSKFDQMCAIIPDKIKSMYSSCTTARDFGKDYWNYNSLDRPYIKKIIDANRDAMVKITGYAMMLQLLNCITDVS
jgi:hypothetical protein